MRPNKVLFINILHINNLGRCSFWNNYLFSELEKNCEAKLNEKEKLNNSLLENANEIIKNLEEKNKLLEKKNKLLEGKIKRSIEDSEGRVRKIFSDRCYS